MTERVCNVLFLCSGNSARSIIAESILNAVGNGRFKGHSAGSRPGGAVNPLVLEFLRSSGLPTEGARSKSWDEFATPAAPHMDLVVTVCDQAAGETCPIWPGHPARAHWSAPDPAAYMADPEQARRVIRDVFQLMHRRILLLTSLPMATLERPALEAEAKAIAEGTAATVGTPG